MTVSSALSFEHVSHAYDRVEAVKDVSFTVNPGEVLCLVGPSGCGKSTVLRLAAGLEALQQGHVHIAGELAAYPRQPTPRDTNPDTGELLTGGSGRYPIWESCVLRPAFRALFTDWENGAANFPDLGDAVSPDPATDPT